MHSFLRLSLIAMALLLALPARATTLCVDTVSELTQAINGYASEPDDSTLTIKVVQGNYLVNALLTSAPHDADERLINLKLLGGYSAGCASRTINPLNTVIDANNQANTALSFFLGEDANATVEGITLTRFVAQSGHAVLNLESFYGFSSEAIFAIRHCRFLSNTGHQIVNVRAAQMDVVNNQISNNTLLGGGAAALLATWKNEGDSRIALNNNTIVANAGGAGVMISTDTRDSARISEIAGNILWGNGGTDLVFVQPNLPGSPAPLITANVYGSVSGTSMPAGNSTANPQFVNAAGGNYTLAAGSPAINSGPSLQLYGFPTRDLTGGARIIGSLIDRGAHEASVSDQSTFLVTTAADNGNNSSPITGSLRAAIKAANASTQPFKINFAISGACPRVVSLAAPMLDIVRDVSIDGSTQPGWVGNSSYSVFDATLCLVVNGSGSTPYAFHVPSNASGARLTVNGMMFAGFTDAALKLEGGAAHRISGNQFGAVPFTSANNDAIRVTGNSGRAVIGGFDDTGAVNLIAGSSNVGVYLDNIDGGSVLGNNVIGFQVDGNGNGANGTGVFIFNSPGNSLQYNHIGNSLSNGVSVSGAASSGTFMQYNVIGRSRNSAPAGNQGAGVGILFGARNSTIGAPLNSVFGGNQIVNNVGPGVWNSASGGAGNRVLVNQLASNGALDIDLASAGPSANQASNPASGPNQLQNYPQLSLATRAGASNSLSTIGGSLHSAPNSAYRIDVYYSLICDSSAPGRGKADVFIGRSTVTTNAAGDASFSFDLTLPFAGLSLGVVAATATSASGDTSEIGNCINEVSTSLPDLMFRNGFE